MSEDINYHWEGYNSQGDSIKGIVSARNLTIAKILISQQEIQLKSINKQRRSIFKWPNSTVKPEEISVFSRQFAVLIKAGIPLLKALDILAQGQSNQRVTLLIESIKMKLEAGCSLAESLAYHPESFNTLYCNLVDAGEKSSSLDIILSTLADYKEKIEKNKMAIKKALTYPLAIMIVACFVTAALLIYVVPEFDSLFKSFGADLPLFTQWIIYVSNLFIAYWYILPTLILLCTLSLTCRKKNIGYLIDPLLLKLPVIGTIIAKTAIARFSRTLSITFAGGLPLNEALQCVASAAGNIVYQKAIKQVLQDICNGEQIHESMSHIPLFPTMLVRMIAVGEESGSLEQMLVKAADFYEQEVDNAVAMLNHLLEPLIMSLLGILVGGLIIAMYLPVFKLGSAI